MLKVRETCTLGCPLVRRLTGIKEMKVKTITVGKFHNMGYAPDMGHLSVIVFHFIYLSVLVENNNILFAQ